MIHPVGVWLAWRGSKCDRIARHRKSAVKAQEAMAKIRDFARIALVGGWVALAPYGAVGAPADDPLNSVMWTEMKAQFTTAIGLTKNPVSGSPPWHSHRILAPSMRARS